MSLCKLALVLCSAIVCLYADELAVAESGHHEMSDHHGHHAVSDKHHDDGHNKGHHDWSKGAHKKYDVDWGKHGKTHHGSANKWGSSHGDKHGLDKHGDKWAHANGGKKSNDFSVWGNKENWHKDKGNGYIKTYAWDKAGGHKDAHGKKGHHADHWHKSAHGDKHGLKKWGSNHGDKHGQNHHNADKSWKDWEKKDGNSGHHEKGSKHWHEKHPEHWAHHKESKNSKHHNSDNHQEHHGHDQGHHGHEQGHQSYDQGHHGHDQDHHEHDQDHHDYEHVDYGNDHDGGHHGGHHESHIYH